MERREFLKVMAGTAAMAAASCAGGTGAVRGVGDDAPLRPGRTEKVFLAGTRTVATEQELKTAVREAALAATDFSWLSKGDAVFIKPVNNSGNPYPATTSPLAIAAMVELLRDKGAGRIVVGDMSGVEFVRFSASKLTGSTRALMESSGIARAVQESGAELCCFEEAGWNAFFEDAPASGPLWKGPIMMPAVLREVDHIVLMPRCARHVLAGSTMGLKAAVGYWRHDTRLEYHRDGSTLQEKTAEGNTVVTLQKKQRLVLTLADRMLATFGPDQGYVLTPEAGLAIASTDVLSHDMVSLAWLLENRRSLPASEQDGFLDTSPMVARFANRFVTNWLGGIGEAFSSTTLVKNDLKAIWDDRVLTHGCRISGGVPVVALEAANGALPESLRRRLHGMVSLTT